MSDGMENQALARIWECGSIEQLREMREQFHEHLKGVPFSLSVEEIMGFINVLHEAVIQRVIQLSEMAMSDIGMGPPPVYYAFVLFGSGGRVEQTLWSDQDNGLIYDSSGEQDRKEIDLYFEQFSLIIVANLVKAGYPPCEGKVGVDNIQWRKSTDEWKSMILSWMEEGEWEHVRYLLIAADIRFIFGHKPLLEEVKHYFLENIRNKPGIYGAMLKNTLRHKMLVGMFGNLIKEQYGEDAGSIDIKYGAYIPFVNGIRLLALQKQIQETSTLRRLDALTEEGVISETQRNEWTKAFIFILQLRMMASYQIENGMYTSGGKLKVKSLSKDFISQLKESVQTGKEMQKYIQKTFSWIGQKRGDIS